MTAEASSLLRPAARRPLILPLLALLSLGLAALGGWESWRLLQETHTTQARLARVQRQLARPAMQKPSKADTDLQRRWQALAQERAFNWYPLFRALEQSAGEDIELVEFLPDKAARRMVLRGEARDGVALSRYLRTLAVQRGLSEVYLAHQKTVQRGSLAPLAFEIRMLIVEPLQAL